MFFLRSTTTPAETVYSKGYVKEFELVVKMFVWSGKYEEEHDNLKVNEIAFCKVDSDSITLQEAFVTKVGQPFLILFICSNSVNNCRETIVCNRRTYLCIQDEAVFFQGSVTFLL